MTQLWQNPGAIKFKSSKSWLLIFLVSLEECRLIVRNQVELQKSNSVYLVYLSLLTVIHAWLHLPEYNRKCSMMDAERTRQQHVILGISPILFVFWDFVTVVVVRKIFSHNSLLNSFWSLLRWSLNALAWTFLSCGKLVLTDPGHDAVGGSVLQLENMTLVSFFCLNIYITAEYWEVSER